MHIGHLQGRKVCDAVLRKGKVWKGKTMIIHWLPGLPKRQQPWPAHTPVLIGTFASARLSKSAVTRNRMRRRVREAFRLSLKERGEMPQAQLLLCPRLASLDAPFDDIVHDAHTFLSALT